MDKIPIADQIAEVERELRLRVGVYEKWIENGRLKQSTADLHMARLTAVRDTLKWLAKNEAVILGAIDAKTKAQPNPSK